MTTKGSATEVGLIGNPKSNLNTSCLPTNGGIMLYFIHFFKNQNVTANDALKKSSWQSVHSKQLLKIFELWKKFMAEASRRSIKLGLFSHQQAVFSRIFSLIFSSYHEKSVYLCSD